MPELSRRGFLKRTAITPSLLCGLAAGSEDLLRAQPRSAPRYDLIVKGGRLIDPAQSISAARDIAVSGTKIARVASDIPVSEARHILDAKGKIVTPGLIDVHTHVYDGVAPLGIPADPNCIAKGVTDCARCRIGGGSHVSGPPQIRHQRCGYARLCAIEYLCRRSIDAVR